MKMQLATIGLGLILLVGESAQTHHLRSKNCDRLGQIAQAVAEKRDAEVSANDLRATLNDPHLSPDIKTAVNILITHIYAKDAKSMKPHDVALEVTEGCLSGGNNRKIRNAGYRHNKKDVK